MKDNEIINRLLQDLGDDAKASSLLADLVGEREGFGPDFAERTVAAAIAPPRGGWMDELPGLFRWVAIAGAAAAVVLITWSWYSTGSLDLDTSIGLADVAMDDSLIENPF